MPFVKGDVNINRKGRPQKGKALLPLLRDKLFALALKRMKRDPEMQDLSNETLVRFIAANLPRDMSLNVSRDPVINYISHVPRPAVTNEYVPINIEEEKKPTLALESELVDTQEDKEI